MLSTFFRCPKCGLYYNEDDTIPGEGEALDALTARLGSDGWEQKADEPCGCTASLDSAIDKFRAEPTPEHADVLRTTAFQYAGDGMITNGELFDLISWAGGTGSDPWGGGTYQGNTKAHPMIDRIIDELDAGRLTQAELLRVLGIVGGDRAKSLPHIAEARRGTTEELEIDDYPLLSRSERGTWVSAWIYVYDTDAGLPDPDDEHADYKGPWGLWAVRGVGDEGTWQTNGEATILEFPDRETAEAHIHRALRSEVMGGVAFEAKPLDLEDGEETEDEAERAANIVAGDPKMLADSLANTKALNKE